MEEENRNRGGMRGWRLDKTISITHIATTISAIAALVIFGSNLNTRLSTLEQTYKLTVEVQHSVDSQQNAATEDFKQIVRSDLRDISQKLDRIIERQMK